MIEQRFISKMFCILQNKNSLGIQNKKITNRDIQLIFIKKMEESILCFNVKKYDKAYEIICDSKIISEKSQFAEILLVYKGYDKNVLGDFLAKRKSPNENGEILDLFVKHIDFRNMDILQALKTLLAVVNLPPEASLMLAIIEVFSNVFYEDNKNTYSDINSIYLFACSILSLNSLFHNTIHKDKMPLESFCKMNSSIDRKITEKIYNQIKNNKIEIIYDCK